MNLPSKFKILDDINPSPSHPDHKYPIDHIIIYASNIFKCFGENLSHRICGKRMGMIGRKS